MADIPSVVADLGWKWTPFHIKLLEEKLQYIPISDQELKKLFAQHFNSTPKVDQATRLVLSKAHKAKTRQHTKEYSILNLESFEKLLSHYQRQGYKFRSCWEFTTLASAALPVVQEHVRQLAKVQDMLTYEAAFGLLALAVMKTDHRVIPVAEFDPVSYFDVHDCEHIRLEKFQALRSTVFAVLDEITPGSYSIPEAKKMPEVPYA